MSTVSNTGLWEQSQTAEGMGRHGQSTYQLDVRPVMFWPGSEDLARQIEGLPCGAGHGVMIVSLSTSR